MCDIDHETIQIKARRPAVALSRCDACNKVLDETEASIRGYATGAELGLCRKCASFVNTRQAIDYAEKRGFAVESQVVIALSGRPENYPLEDCIE